MFFGPLQRHSRPYRRREGHRHGGLLVPDHSGFPLAAFSLFANDGATGEGDDLVGIEKLIGGSADDTLTALGSTPGILVGGLGADTLRGGPNNDQILSRDGIQDTVNCGDGLDIGEVDLRDVGFAATCESGGEQDRGRGRASRSGPGPPAPRAPGGCSFGWPAREVRGRRARGR